MFAQIMKLPLQGSHMGREVGHLLGEISEDEHTHGRPMLSAVAVGVSGYLGEGFFAFARELGKLTKEGKVAADAFWTSERDAVYATWARSLTN